MMVSKLVNILSFGMPEAWMLNLRWRNMLNSNVYFTRLCALAVDEAHVIRQW